MFNPRVLPLSVFSDEHRVNVLVWGFETFDRGAWTNIGKQIEGPSESKVEGDVALSN
jgi:hypothetical protein